MLIAQWTFPFAINKPRKKNKCKCRTFNYKAMTKEKWEDFSNQINSNIHQHKITTEIDNTISLEKLWHKIYTCIINAALQHIPNKKQTIKHSFHTFSPKATALHKDLKLIGNIIYKVKNSFKYNLTISTQIINNINTINHKHNFDILNLPENPSLLPQWIDHAKQAWKALFHARSIENTQHLKQHINTATNKDMNN